MRKSRAGACRCGLFILSMLAASVAAPAHAETLRWKLKPGETLHWVMERKEEFREVRDERESKVSSSQTINMSWIVKKVAENGTADLVLKIDRVVAKLRTPYGAFEFDSSGTKAPTNQTEAGMQESMKPIVGAEFQCKFSPLGELSDVRLPEQLSKAIAEQKKDDPNANPALAEDQFKKMFTGMSMALPKEDVAPGKTWTVQTKEQTPPAGNVTIDTTFRFRGPDAQAGENVVRIDLESKFTNDLPANKEVRVTIKTQERSGSLFFDTAAGRIVKSSASDKNERKIEPEGMEIELSNTSSTNVTLAK